MYIARNIYYHVDNRAWNYGIICILDMPMKHICLYSIMLYIYKYICLTKRCKKPNYLNLNPIRKLKSDSKLDPT